MPARRRPNTKLALRIARAQLKLLKGLMPSDFADFAMRSQIRRAAEGQPARFIQCWSVGRGYSGITQCLDSDGQVWERVSVIEKVGGVSQLKASWWERLDMRRGKPEP